jgi:hypothetical protein
MAEPEKELTIEEKILAEKEDVEQQYTKNEDEIQRLKVLLNQRMQKRMQLEGQHTALCKLLPKQEKQLPAKDNEE